MSNPVAPCIHAKTMAVATNDDDESRQGMMGEFPVRADASCTAPLFDVCEVGTRLSLSSRSVHQAEGTGATGDAQSQNDPAYAECKRERRKDPAYAERERARKRDRYQKDPAYAERHKIYVTPCVSKEALDSPAT